MTNQTYETDPQRADLAEDFAQLRNNARSLKDIETWMMAHPEVLAGSLTVEAVNACRVDVVPTPNILAKGVNEQCMSVCVRVFINQAAFHHPLLQSQMAQCMAHDTSDVTTTSMLTMPLRDWPLATAMVVSRWVFYCTDITKYATAKEYAPLLDSMLALHFPSVTCENLRSMVDAGLISVAQNGDVATRFGHIQDYLFASRESHYNGVINLPLDIAP